MAPPELRLSNAPASVGDDPLEEAQHTRAVVGAGGVIQRETALALAGMHCAACALTIEDALRAVPGVASASVSAASERASVRYDPAQVRPSALIAAVRAAGYDAVPDAAEPARALRRAEMRLLTWRLFVAAFCSMQVMMLAWPSYVASVGSGFNDIAPDHLKLLNWGSWLLSLPVLAFSSSPFLGGAWRAIRQRRIGMDVPVALGIVLTFVASSAATFEPQGLFGSHVYFDSLTMFVALLLAARWFDLRARHRAAEELEGSLARTPEVAWRVDAAGQVQAVSALRLVAGDRVRVPLGQAFPADGVLLAGCTSVDESLLSGESVPRARGVGDEIVAGSLNLSAPVEMRVARVGADTRLAAIVALMQQAMTERPASALVADRWAGPFLWTVLLLAAASAAAWSVIDPSRAIWVAVSVLVVTCPCALSLATPATLVAAARGLARRGVLLRRLDAIEALAGVQQVFFDKTGTLSSGRQTLRAVRVVHGQGRESALRAVAVALAGWSTHPLSRALVEAAPCADPPPALHEVQEHPGQGVSARDADGCRWRLGSAAWVLGEAGQGMQGDVASLWLARDGTPVAAFEFEETLRPDAHDALRQLQAAGLAVTLLTGDTPERAKALLQRADAEGVALVAAANPEAKRETVRRAQSAGACVAVVGDGINDAPVLAQADVSIAMGQGALLARAQADLVLTGERPADVLLARERARRALALVRQNLVGSLLYNAAALPLAMAGWLPPWLAGAGMAASSLLVVLNAQRAAR